MGPVTARRRCMGDEGVAGLRWWERVEERDEVVEDDVEGVVCERSSQLGSGGTSGNVLDGVD